MLKKIQVLLDKLCGPRVVNGLPLPTLNTPVVNNTDANTPAKKTDAMHKASVPKPTSPPPQFGSNATNESNLSISAEPVVMGFAAAISMEKADKSRKVSVPKPTAPPPGFSPTASNASSLSTSVTMPEMGLGDSCRKISVAKPTAPPPQFMEIFGPQVSIAKPTGPPPHVASIAKPTGPPPRMVSPNTSVAGTSSQSDSLKKPTSSESFFRNLLGKRSKKEVRRFPPLTVLPGCHPEDLEAARQKIPLDYILSSNNKPLFGELGIKVQQKMKEERERAAKDSGNISA